MKIIMKFPQLFNCNSTFLNAKKKSKEDVFINF